MSQRIALYCLCGAVSKGSMDARGEALWRRWWENEHTGKGHGEATLEQARRARRLAESGEDEE